MVDTAGVHKLIYASRATGTFSEADLEAMLVVSRQRNAESGISGLLLYCQNSFLQLLEGEVGAVAATYTRIEADPRHAGLRLLSYAPITERSCGEWSMGFDHADEERLEAEIDGYRPAASYPLVSASLITNGTVAETLLQANTTARRCSASPRADRSTLSIAAVSPGPAGSSIPCGPGDAHRTVLRKRR